MRLGELEKFGGSDGINLPPNDAYAEQCLLASLMLAGDDRETFDLSAAGVRPHTFFSADHSIIFSTLARMRAAETGIDAVTVRADLMRQGMYEEIGGDEYLSRILGLVPTHHHGPHYGAIVREKYTLREIIRVANTAIRRVFAASIHDRSNEIARELYEDLASVAITGDAEKIHHISDVIAEVVEANSGTSTNRFKTGLMELDDVIGGVATSRFTLIGGRPGMGKSMACKQLALNIAGTGTPCGIITIEETREKIGQNYLSNLSGVENRRIVLNRLDQWDAAAVAATLPDFHDLPIFIADTPTRLAEVASTATTMIVKHKCRVVIVDYHQLITPDGSGDNENREITIASKTLKNLFKRSGVAGVVAAQLNRGNESQGVRRPELRDFRGSGTIEQDADCAILLHREDYYHRNEEGYVSDHKIEFIVAKNKDGPNCMVPCYFDGRTQRVVNWNARPTGSPEFSV